MLKVTTLELQSVERYQQDVYGPQQDLKTFQV